MEYIKVKINLKNTFSEKSSSNSSNDLDYYIDYLQDTIYDKIKDNTNKVTFNSDIFGNLKIEIGFEEIDIDGTFSISADIYYDTDKVTEDDWFDNFEKDNRLLEFLDDQFKKYVEDCNNICKDLYIPIDNFRFDRYTNDLFIEVDIKNKRIPNLEDVFKPFKIDYDIYIDDIAKSI